MSIVTIDGAMHREMLIDALVYRAIVETSQDYQEVLLTRELGKYLDLGIKILKTQTEKILENKYNLKCINSLKLEIDDKSKKQAKEEIRSILINNLLLLPDPGYEPSELNSVVFRTLEKIDSQRDKFRRK